MAIISEQNKVGYGSIDPSSTLSDVDEQVGLLAPSSVPFETRRKDDKRRMSVMVMAGLGAFALLGLFACSNNSTATPTALENREASLTKSLESTMMGAPHVDPATTDMLNTPKKNDPTKRVYFTQIIDHNNPTTSGTFQQGYYENYNHWRGPGHRTFGCSLPDIYIPVFIVAFSNLTLLIFFFIVIPQLFFSSLAAKTRSLALHIPSSQKSWQRSMVPTHLKQSIGM